MWIQKEAKIKFDVDFKYSSEKDGVKLEMERY